MIALHKPERTTYGQAVEAQQEYAVVICQPNVFLCWGDGDIECCY